LCTVTRREYLRIDEVDSYFAEANENVTSVDKRIVPLSAYNLIVFYV
jgi:hypothetical protein